MNKVLFVIPDKSYKSQDFVNASIKLNLDMVIVTDSNQASEQLGAKNIFSTDFKSLDYKLIDKLPKDIDLVLPVDHSSVTFASILVEKLSTTGNRTQAVENCLSKERTRRILSASGLFQPKYEKAKTLEHVNRWRDKINVKTIIKPDKGVASIGVMSLEKDYTYHEQIQKIIDNCPTNEVVIEEFIIGEEFAFEGYLKDGLLKRVVIFDKPGDYQGPYYEEKIFVAPAEIDLIIIKKIENVCQRACASLGLTDGPVHIEFKIIEDEIFIIEVNPRTIGGLCSRSLNFNLFKNSLEEVILSDLLLDRKISLDLASPSSGVLMLPIPADGIFKGLDNENKAKEIDEVANIELSLPIGSNVRKPPFSERYLGFVFANGENNNKTTEALLQCEKILSPIIE